METTQDLPVQSARESTIPSKLELQLNTYYTKIFLGSNLKGEGMTQCQSTEPGVWPWAVVMHAAEPSALWEEGRKSSANRKRTDRAAQVARKEELKMREKTQSPLQTFCLYAGDQWGRGTVPFLW